MLSLVIKQTYPVVASTRSVGTLRKINFNSSNLFATSSKLSNFNNSPFCVRSIPSRRYSSFKLNTNLNTNSKFLLVAQKNSLVSNNSKNMSTTSVNFKLVKSYDNIVKSSQDKRVYRGLLLDNHLKCLLVSDPSTDRSAASVDVHSGYMVDPKEFPGLAHFCEHMLFMGSKKVQILISYEICSFVKNIFFNFLSILEKICFRNLSRTMLGLQMLILLMRIPIIILKLLQIILKKLWTCKI